MLLGYSNALAALSAISRGRLTLGHVYPTAEQRLQELDQFPSAT